MNRNELNNRPEGMRIGSVVSAKGPREVMTGTSPEAWQFPPSDETETENLSKEKKDNNVPKNLSGSLRVLCVFIESINERVSYIDVVPDVVPDVVVMLL